MSEENVIYLRDHRRTEPEVASISDACEFWFVAFNLVVMASLEVAAAMQREIVRGAGGPVQ